MRTWKRNSNEIQQLVDAFYMNDPYYPRPNPKDPLYDAINVEAFLRAIENEQRRRKCQLV
jgi:hypothetical protein